VEFGRIVKLANITIVRVMENQQRISLFANFPDLTENWGM